jgi:hypothetical protein
LLTGPLELNSASGVPAVVLRGANALVLAHTPRSSPRSDLAAPLRHLPLDRGRAACAGFSKPAVSSA